MTKRLSFSCVAVALFTVGCVTPVEFNAPLSRFDPTGGYRFKNLHSEGNSDELFVILTFSGGGTRAAALSYGVLEQLKGTTVNVGGVERRLLDEVDVISTVSGGSFTGAYYAAFGDRIFEDFHEKVLNKPIRSAIVNRVLFLPHNWFRLGSAKFDVGDLAERYYAKHIFDEMRFQGLVTAGRRPFLIVNATDMTLTAPFEFTQDQFDLLYSDLGSVPVSKAVAASAALPCVLAGIVLRNYDCRPDFTAPGWIAAVLQRGDSDLRRWEKARQAESYTRPGERPYIHLLDGGLVDNLGLEPVLCSLDSEDSPWSVRNMLLEKRVKKVVIIVVNAGNKSQRLWDKGVDRPTVAEMFITSIQAMQDSKTVELRARLNEVCGQLQKEFAPDGVKFYVTEVSFDRMASMSAQRYFHGLPTDLQLPKKAVEDLRLVGGRLLLESEKYQELLRDLGGSAAPLEPKMPRERR